MKKFLVVILGMVLLAAVGCGSEQKQADGKLPVVASFYPMADLPDRSAEIYCRSIH